VEGVIVGTVRSGEVPVAFARVMVESAPGPMPDIALLSGPDGRFAVDTPYRGRYVLVVYADEHRPARIGVDVPDPGRSTETVVELPP